MYEAETHLSILYILHVGNLSTMILAESSMKWLLISGVPRGKTFLE